MILTFTPTELAILLHRAELPDCLGEVYGHTKYAEAEARGELLTDTEFNAFIAEGVQAAEDLLRVLTRDKCLDVRRCSEGVYRFIVEDWIDGSTYFASWEEAVACGQVSRQKIQADMLVAERLQERLIAAGFTVKFPLL